MRDFYRVLGVSRNASQAEIKVAYRKLVLQYHPDRNPHDPHAADMLKMINEAYGVLSDLASRSTYNTTNGINDSVRNSENVAAEDKPYENKIKRYSKEWAEIWQTPTEQQYGVSPFIAKLLKVDFAISILFTVYCFVINSKLPALASGVHVPIGRQYGGGGTWMVRLIVAGIVGPIISAWALFKLSQTTKSHFLGHYLTAKCFLFVWLVSGVVGLSSFHMKITVSLGVLIWNIFIIATVFIYRLDQDVGGSR